MKTSCSRWGGMLFCTSSLFAGVVDPGSKNLEVTVEFYCSSVFARSDIK